jgi:hypothetical protein
MLGFGRKRRSTGERTLFRVSDVVDVPLRGIVLRLRVVEGTPAFGDFAVGELLEVEGPTGEQRRVRITGHSLTGGRQSQERLDRTRELDVLIEPAGGVADEVPIEIGWMARGPIRDD